MANQENHSKGKVDILHEESSLESFFLKIKNISFQVLSVLLKNEEEEVFMIFIMTGVDYMQMHSFPFHAKLQHIWKATTFLKIIFEIFNVFQIKNYMPHINFTTYIMGIYFLDFIILLIILDILYVSYSFSQKKFSITWPLKILNQVTSYFVTVFFLPITENLFSVLECETNPEGVLSLAAFETIECWKGWMLAHQIITSLFNIIFVIISSIVALTFFEPRMTSKNKTARQDSLAEVIFIFTKVACQVLFNFVPEGNDWFLVLITFTFSASLYWSYNFEEPYYDKFVGKFFNIATTYYLWTNVMLLVSLVFYETGFNGGLIIWILGLPFICFIMLTSKKSRIDTLISSQTKFRSGEQIQGHLRYVLELIGTQKTDRNSYMLLIGYVEKHKEVCQEEDCPLKIKKTRKGKHADIEMDEIIKNLIKELGRLYQNGLRKFPTCTKLRLSYAFFLFERLKKKEEALVQFKLSMTTKPTFDEQFIIYRYIEQISSSQEEEEDDDEEEENDVVKKIEFDSHMSQCEEYIKLAAIKHKEFWANLREDNNIALGRLNILGSGISQCVYKSREHFNGMLKINSQLPQPYKVFGQYLIRVLNQREQGIELLQKGRELAKLQQKTYKIDDIEDLINDPRPYLVTNKKLQQNTQIQAINLLFSVLFGFQKEEIQGKELKAILPNQFVDIHETLIQQMNDNMIQGNYVSQYIDNPQQRFGKHRSGYIFPISYNVKQLSDDFSKFYVNIEADMQNRSQIIILTNEEFAVTDISSSAITYFDINLSMIKNETKFGIENIISDFNEEKQIYLKKGKEFNFNNQTFMVNCQTQLVPIENKDAIDEEQYLTYEVLGYIFKIDKLERGMIMNQQYVQQQHQQPSLNIHSNSSFQNFATPPNLNQKETFKDLIKELQQENIKPQRDTQFTYRDTITQNTYRDTVTENTYRDTYREETAKLNDHNSLINYSNNQPLSSPIQNIPIITSTNNLSMTNLSNQNLFSQGGQSTKNVPQSIINNNGNAFNLNIQNLQFNKKTVSENSPLPLSSNRKSIRNVMIKQKNESSQNSFPMIVLEQNNLADQDLASSSNQEEVNHCSQKQNKFSKFLFDFYKTPAEDDTFVFDKDDSTNQYSMVKKETKNYAKQIKTKRLFNNQLINIYDGDDGQEEEDEENEDSVFKNENNYYQSQEEYVVFNQNNTSQIIQKSLNYEHKHQLISLFKWVSFMWIMCVLIISIFQCVLTITRLNQYSEDLDIMFKFSQRNYKAVSIVSQAIDSVYTQQNLYFPNYIFMDEIRQNISSTIISISNITTSIGESYLDYFADNQSSSQLKMFSSSLQNNFLVQYVDNDELINSLISLGALLISQDDSQINISNGYFNSIIFNYYHTIGEFLEYQNQQIYNTVDNRFNSPQYELMAAFFVLGTIGILNMILYIYFMISLKDQRENILFLFLDIPIKHINFLYKNCDSFLKKYVSIQELINRNENQGQDSSDEEDQERDINTRKLYKDDQKTNNDDEKELEQEIMKKRSKIIKNYKKHKFRGQQFMILKCFILLAFSFIYSIIDLVQVVKLQQQISSLLDQYYYDLNISYKFQNYFNVLKITLILPNYPIENITAQNYVINQYNKLLGRNGQLKEFNFDILNNYDDIRNAYYKVFYSNSCSLLNQEIQSECEIYINNNLKIGMDNAIQFYASFFQQTLNELLINGAQGSTLSQDKFFVETNISLQKFVDPIMQYFTSAENNSLTASIEKTNSLETLLVILFNLFLIIAFLIFWLPKISDMNVEINRTIQMLNMIPLKVMKENRNIRVFIKYLIDQTHRQSDT